MENKEELHIKPVLAGLVGPWYSGKRMFAHFNNTNIAGSKIISISEQALKNANKNGANIDPSDRAALREYMVWQRTRNGADYFVRNLPLTKVENYTLLIVRSMKNKSEVEYLKSIGAKIVCINADPEVRYKRYCVQAGKSALPFEIFIQNEKDDFPQLEESMKLADISYVNNEENYERPSSKFHFNFCTEFYENLPAHFSQFKHDHKLFDSDLAEQLIHSRHLLNEVSKP